VKTQHLIWIFWFVGQAFHILAQANALAGSTVEGRVKTIGDVLRTRWIAFSARLFITTCAFLIILSAPSLIPNLPGGVVGAGAAGLLGWGADSILAFIPGLKTSLPPLNGKGEGRGGPPNPIPPPTPPPAT
jgi:hypothetical protein